MSTINFISLPHSPMTGRDQRTYLMQISSKSNTGSFVVNVPSGRNGDEWDALADLARSEYKPWLDEDEIQMNHCSVNLIPNKDSGGTKVIPRHKGVPHV